MTHPESTTTANPAQVTDAAAIVEALFQDIRDRRFLKWLFPAFEGAGPILHDQYGEPLMPFDLDVQGEIKAAWAEIITAAIGAGGQAVTDGVEWHRTDGAGSILLYTLMQDGWRKGESVMVNDVMVRIEAANGSKTPIEPIAERILSAIAHPVQPGWRDIESAPKDGTEILVCGPAEDGGAYRDVQRWPKNWSGKWPVSYMAYAAGEPTHWMPLPVAPQPKGE